MAQHLLLGLSVLVLAACSNSSNQSTSSADSGRTTGADTTTASSSNSKALELVFEDNTYQLTGVAKGNGGPLYVNYPRWSGPYRYAVVTAADKDSAHPYPNEAMNNWSPGLDGKNKWVCVQSVYVDDSGTTWVLDPSAPQLKKIQGGGAKLVKMDASGKPQRSYSFMGTVSDTSYVNDVRIDTQRQFAYLTDSKSGGLVIVDLNTGKMREVLTRHPSTKSDPNFKFIIDGRELMKEGKPAKFNSDGIALTPDGNWIYYKPLSDDKLYRIRTDYLRDWNMADTALHGKVEDLGHFTTTDGMIFDKAGNLYLGDLQRYRIVRIDPQLKMTTVVEDQRLIWPDSYAIADGYLYVSCSQINKQPDYNEGVNKRTSPYTVYRIKL